MKTLERPDRELTAEEYIQKYRGIDWSGKAHADFTKGRISRGVYHYVMSIRFEEMAASYGVRRQ